MLVMLLISLAVGVIECEESRKVSYLLISGHFSFEILHDCD